jgi:hypothetical protein
MNPLPEVVLSQLVIRAILRQHTKYLKITTTLCRWGSLNPYKDYSSLLRWQANIFAHMPLQNCINEGMSWFLECSTYFVIDDFILLFVAFVELLGLVTAFFSIYEIIWLFVLSWRTLSEMPMLVMKWNAHVGDEVKCPWWGWLIVLLQVH